MLTVLPDCAATDMVSAPLDTDALATDEVGGRKKYFCWTLPRELPPWLEQEHGLYSAGAAGSEEACQWAWMQSACHPRRPRASMQCCWPCACSPNLINTAAS